MFFIFYGYLCKILKIYIFIFVVIAVGKVILLLHSLIFIGWIRRNYGFFNYGHQSYERNYLKVIMIVDSN